jgi:hypothetical protein
MSAGRQGKAFAFGALFVATLALAGCSTTVADMPGVAPADAPARPQEAGMYPPVNDLPPNRDQAVLDPSQRDKIEKELIAARDRQASTGAPAAPTSPTTGNQAASSRQKSHKPATATATDQNASANASAQASAAK